MERNPATVQRQSTSKPSASQVQATVANVTEPEPAAQILVFEIGSKIVLSRKEKVVVSKKEAVKSKHQRQEKQEEKEEKEIRLQRQKITDEQRAINRERDRQWHAEKRKLAATNCCRKKSSICPKTANIETKWFRSTSRNKKKHNLI